MTSKENPVVLREAPKVVGGDVQISAAAQTFLSEARGVAETERKPPIIRINHKEGKFELPGGELAPEVAGYVLYQFQTRSWYKSAYKAGERKPPDCFSTDTIRPDASSPDPQGSPEGTCAGCPMSAFGTGRDGRSQACATRGWLFLFNSAFGAPPVAALVAPPSSLSAVYGSRFQAGYLERLKNRHGAYQIVWSVFTLEHHGEGVEYSTLVPHAGPVLTDAEQLRALAQFHNTFRPALEAMRGKAGEDPTGAGDQGGEDE